MRKFAILFLLLCAAASFYFPRATAQSNLPRNTEGREKDLSRLLRRYERLRVDVPEAVGKIKRGERLAFLTSEGNLEVELVPNDLRGESYRAEETRADGRRRPAPSAGDEVRTFRGRVEGLEGAEARFNLDDGAFEGMIITEGERFYLERLGKYEDAAEADEYIFYRGSDVLEDAPGYCGVTLETELAEGTVGVSDQVTTAAATVQMAGATLKEADIATEADFEYVTALGGSAPANAEILSILNLIDGIYETQLGISLKVVYQHTWASKPTGYPYTASLDGPTLLNEFTAHWNQSFTGVARDVAHLWTAKDITSNGSSGLAGIAWVGVVCNTPSHSYGLSQRFTSAAIKQALTAHEMGHNFSASHSDAQTGCAGTIMSSSVSDLLSFCSYSRTQIQNHTTSFGACLRTVETAAPALSSVTLGAPSTANGAPVGGRVTLTAAASANGAVVTLSDDLAATTLPASVLVPAGQTFATFTITSVAVTTTQTGTVTASYGTVKKTAAFSVVPGLSISGTVLNGTAGVGGVKLTLTSTTTGFTPRTATSSATGTYAFTGLAPGRTYVVTPSSAIFNFTQANQTVSGMTANATGRNFTVSTRKTYSVAGRVTRAGTTTGLGGVTVRLLNSTGGLVKSALTAADGTYTLPTISAGFNYTAAPVLAGYTFSPASRPYTNLSANQTGQNFAAAGLTISGRVLYGTAGVGGVAVRLTSTSTTFAARTTTTAADGSYSFGSVTKGLTYTVTPSSVIYNFTPASRSYTALAASQTAQNFAVASRKTYSITGRVTRAGTTTGIAGVTVTLLNSAGAVARTVKTDSAGNYSLTALSAGYNWTVRPSLAGWAFTPASRAYTNFSANQVNQSFGGTQ